MSPEEKSALVIGFGMGALLDFLLLHLVLQWHHMISARLPPDAFGALQVNIFWDGTGQGIAWLIVVYGVFLLLRGVRRPTASPSLLRYTGLLLVGWGFFNLLDGVFNHHLLGLHNIREDVLNKTAWNLGFLLIAGILLPAFGAWLARRGLRSLT